LLKSFGPGLVGGITFGRWWQLLRDNRFGIAARGFPRALSITCHSMLNTCFAWYENLRYGAEVADVTVLPPLFVLGHWRNGTTHLHNLFCIDDRFAFPNNYQVLCPSIFLSTEALGSRLMAWMLSRRRPMDNIEWTPRSPQEDEFAMCVCVLKSPYLGWVFTRRRHIYDRYLTFQDVPDQEIADWQRAFVFFLKKLTWRYRRPLVLKSPPHTARIKLLLDLFPQAKFVHIHRNPYAVFTSFRWTMQVNLKFHCLQCEPADLDGWIIRQYERMYESFFAERQLIPSGNFHEIGFESLEKDPNGELRRAYEALALPKFCNVEPELDRYLASIAGYRKNRFAELPEDARRRIATSWRRCFDEWGYPV
jgi:hypothetical protein